MEDFFKNGVKSSSSELDGNKQWPRCLSLNATDRMQAAAM